MVAYRDASMPPKSSIWREENVLISLYEEIQAPKKSTATIYERFLVIYKTLLQGVPKKLHERGEKYPL